MCAACPYAKDCPSGVWSAEDYAKLPPYDGETFAQPPEPFACHEAPQLYCHGWAMCHSERGPERDLLALRLASITTGALIPLPEKTGRPHFASGADAAAHGMADIAAPKRRARQMMKKLMEKHARLRNA